MEFQISLPFKPAGDQPKAIDFLTKGFFEGANHQMLLGVTGSGKTFTIANVINKVQKPTLVIAHNKTLAAQLAQEYREFFPKNAVHYFVSYYDFYRPEAYLPVSDTYIEKDAQVNSEIDRLRHATTQSLMTRKDVIVIASVSCIYGLGSPEEYKKVNLFVERGQKLTREQLIKSLVKMYFVRVGGELSFGQFRVIGNNVEIKPANEDAIYRISFSGNEVENITSINSATFNIIQESADGFYLFPAKHFVTDEAERENTLEQIKKELKERVEFFKKQGKMLEADRLNRKTLHDLSLIREVGYCNGIENYSRYFDGRVSGEPPHTLLSYFPRDKNGKPDFLTVIDESHITVPQIKGMQFGDSSRKESLVEYGFRLPSAKDNRPLTFEEFTEKVGQIIYTSATPAEYELEKSGKYLVEQIIRPTGLTDPKIIIRPVVETSERKGQVADFIEETKKVVKDGHRVLATTLSKKSAEQLSEYLTENGVKSEYLHSDIKTIDRIDILTKFRKGEFDCLVGVNLLREGLDLPEVALIGVFDADKEGFLRSTTSLIQTIGRAARNTLGYVILYADRETDSLKEVIKESNRRRNIQLEHNEKNKITPTTIKKKIKDITEIMDRNRDNAIKRISQIDMDLLKKSPKKFVKMKEEKKAEAIRDLDFRTASLIRDELRYLEEEGHIKLTSKRQ